MSRSLLANQYRTVVDISGATTTDLLSADFGFTANYVRVANDGTVPLRVTFASSVATTADHELKTGEIIEYRDAATHALGLTTTSTSTEAGDYKRARVLALGG